MGYASFKSSPKSVTTGDQIGPGQIDLSHLSPALFSEVKQISQHNHTGVKSRRLDLRDIGGSFGTQGFIIYSSDATKKYRLTVDSSLNAIVLTQL